LDEVKIISRIEKIKFELSSDLVMDLLLKGMSVDFHRSDEERI